MVESLIKEDVDDPDYKKYLLEEEIFKSILSNCNNVKYFYWSTEQPIYIYPGAGNFFSNLCSLGISLGFVFSATLLGLSQICQNIEELEINDCDGDIPGLICFIKAQTNLQSLYLHFDNVENQCTKLSDVIKSKASTLKKITIKPDITSISPNFLLSLTNLQYLVLNNDDGDGHESIKLQEWKYYLSMAIFQDLRYLETSYIPFRIEHLLIEKSGGNIRKIKIHQSFEAQDSPTNNRKLIKAISERCLRIIKLSMYVSPENVNEVKKIFSRCKQLKKTFFTTNNNVRKK